MSREKDFLLGVMQKDEEIAQLRDRISALEKQVAGKNKMLAGQATDIARATLRATAAEAQVTALRAESRKFADLARHEAACRAEVTSDLTALRSELEQAQAEASTQRARADSWQETAEKVVAMGGDYYELQADRDAEKVRADWAEAALRHIAYDHVGGTGESIVAEYEALALAALTPPPSKAEGDHVGGLMSIPAYQHPGEQAQA